METVQGILTDIKANLSQRSASMKDEVRVMRGMLNDTDYTVGIYDKSGKVGEYSPANDMRKMMSGVISTTTRIPGGEAAGLMQEYEFTNSDATSCIALSKEFVNTYLSTGRKMNLGGRESCNASLIMKMEPEKIKQVPSSSDQKMTTTIPAHQVIRGQGGCPSWVKNKA